MADVLDDLLNNNNTPTAPESTPVSGNLQTIQPPSGQLFDEAMDTFRQAQGMEYEGSDYDKDISRVLGGIEQAEYDSPYTQDIQDVIGGLKDAEFAYDPETDEAFQQAQKVAQRSVFEEMGARGILPSTVTADRLTGAMGELTGQFREQAFAEFQGTQQQNMNLLNSLSNLDQISYNRFRDQLGIDFKLADYYSNLANQDYSRYVDQVNNLYAQADFISQMDDRQQSQYQQNLDNQYRRDVFDYEKAQTELQNARNQISDAWERTSQLGYVDNAASIVLGVDAGTQSQRAREIEQDLQNQLTVMDQELQNRLREIQASTAQQMALLEAQGAQTRALRDEAMATDPTTVYQNASPSQQRAYTAAKDHFARTVQESGYQGAVREFQRRGELYQQAMGPELSKIFATEVQQVSSAGYDQTMAGGQPDQAMPMADYQSVFDTANRYMSGDDPQPEMAASIIQGSNLSDSEKQQMLGQLNLMLGDTDVAPAAPASETDAFAGAGMTETQAEQMAMDLMSEGSSEEQVMAELDKLGFTLDAEGYIVRK